MYPLEALFPFFFLSMIFLFLVFDFLIRSKFFHVCLFFVFLDFSDFFIIFFSVFF